MCSSDKDLTMARAICADYIKAFPDNKVWITRRFGLRDSYLAGMGEEKFCAAFRIRLTEDYTAFVEENHQMSEPSRNRNERLLKELFERYYKGEGGGI